MRGFPNPRLLFPLLLLQWSSGCAGSTARYDLERKRRLHAERHIYRAEAEIRRLQRVAGSQQRTLVTNRRRITQLQQALAVVRRRLRSVRRALKACPKNPALTAIRSTPPSPRPAHVIIGPTQLWRHRGRPVRRALRTHLESKRSALMACYQRSGWGPPKTQPLRGAVWLVYGVDGGRIVSPRAQQSTLRPTGKYTPEKNRVLQRAAVLEQCLVKVLSSLRVSRYPRMLRVASLVVLADTKTAAARVRRPRLRWPWKRLQGKFAGLRGVCRVGSRHRIQIPGGGRSLIPRFSRPCAKGLRCCYPCGIQGCDSICLRRCPGPLP